MTGIEEMLVRGWAAAKLQIPHFVRDDNLWGDRGGIPPPCEKTQGAGHPGCQESESEAADRSVRPTQPKHQARCPGTCGRARALLHSRTRIVRNVVVLVPGRLRMWSGTARSRSLGVCCNN